MNARNELNWPNAISFLRILLAPVLLVLAHFGMPYWYLACFVVSEFTDVLDGYLARRLNQITALGSRLDSYGDFFIYGTIAVGASWLWPDKFTENIPWIGLIVASFTMPVLLGLIKFRVLTSYHTYSVKLSVAVTVVAYVLLFYLDLEWPFILAAILCALAASEEMLITLISKKPLVDVPSVFHAWRRR